jgi:hypothetical protein
VRAFLGGQPGPGVPGVAWGREVSLLWLLTPPKTLCLTMARVIWGARETAIAWLTRFVAVAWTKGGCRAVLPPLFCADVVR